MAAIRRDGAVANDFSVRAIAPRATGRRLAERLDEPVAERHDARIFQALRPANEVIRRGGPGPDPERSTEAPRCEPLRAQELGRQRDAMTGLGRAERDGHVI